MLRSRQFCRGSAHIPDLADLSASELIHDNEPNHREPNVHCVLADLKTSGDEADELKERFEAASQFTETQHGSDMSYKLLERNAVSVSANKLLTKRRRASVRARAKSKRSFIELRRLFLELVRAACGHQ